MYYVLNKLCVKFENSNLTQLVFETLNKSFDSKFQSKFTKPFTISNYTNKYPCIHYLYLCGIDGTIYGIIYALSI